MPDCPLAGMPDLISPLVPAGHRGLVVLLFPLVPAGHRYYGIFEAAIGRIAVWWYLALAI